MIIQGRYQQLPYLIILTQLQRTIQMTSPKSTQREQQLCQFLLQDLSFEHSPSRLPVQITPTSHIGIADSKQVQLEIQLDNGQKVIMFPQAGQQPMKIAESFCQEHNLDSEMIQVLAESIKKSINHCEEQKKSKYTLTNIQSQPSVTREFISGQSYPISCKTSSQRYSHFLSKKSSVGSQVTLYEKGCRQMQKHKKWVEKERQQNSVRQLRQCTHIPAINGISRSIVSERSFSRMRNKSVVLDERETEMKERKHSLKLCHSIVLAENDKTRNDKTKNKQQGGQVEVRKKQMVRNNSDIFIQLYEYSKNKNKNKSKLQVQLQKNKDYQPKIDSISKEIVGNVKFTQRLTKYEHQRQLKKQKIKKNLAEEKQNLYRPKTGPAPLNRNIDKLPIGDYLYKKHKKVPVLAKPYPVPKVNKNSKQLYQATKQQAFIRVFSHLDARNQGKVSWNTLNLMQIDSSIRDILCPLVQQIQIMKIELAQEDFKVALDFLFNTLTLTQKHLILNFPPETCKQPLQNSTLMNERSKQIISKSSRASMDVYAYGELRKALREESVQNVRVQQQRRQMEECTFQPKIQRKRMYF